MQGRTAPAGAHRGGGSLPVVSRHESSMRQVPWRESLTAHCLIACLAFATAASSRLCLAA